MAQAHGEFSRCGHCLAECSSTERRRVAGSWRQHDLANSIGRTNGSLLGRLRPLSPAIEFLWMRVPAGQVTIQ